MGIPKMGILKIAISPNPKKGINPKSLGRQTDIAPMIPP